MRQLSILGAVSKWSEQFDLYQGERESISGKSPEKEEPVDKEGLNSVNKEILKSVNSQEVNSLVSTPRMEPASGNRLREKLHNFESRPVFDQIAKISELASFLDPVVPGRTYEIMQDVDDGLEDLLQYAENTLILDMTQN